MTAPETPTSGARTEVPGPVPATGAAAGSGPDSTGAGPAGNLRERLAVAIDAAPRCVHPGWESCSEWHRADAAIAVFANWLDDYAEVIFFEQSDLEVVEHLADLIRKLPGGAS